MYFALLFVLSLSLTLQVVAAVLAARLIGVTGKSWAWVAIAVGMSAMAIRRAALLALLLAHAGMPNRSEFWSEVIGLLNAALMLVGIAAIGPLFRAVQKAHQQVREAMEDSHGRLKKEVDRQTSELLAANERLKTEVARRAEAESALREEHRHLSSVLAIYEKDRQLVAYDIHDGFVQTAAAASMGMQAALAAFPQDPGRAQEQVAHALKLLQQSLAQVRSLVRGLRPTELEEAGLVAAIGQLVRDTENDSQVDVQWTPQVAFERLSPALEMSIFRIVQEALTNAVRHSKSGRVAIAMRQSGGTIQLRIEDWGIGFDTTVAKPGHYGLEGIRERARLFGGAARIDSAPGKGTRIEVELPAIQRDVRT